jgi:uncharacterized protein (TIGR03437 family)
VVTLNLTSKSAVNIPKPVRLLINTPDPAQRGTIVDQPGILSDILPDAVRNRVYVLRQDMNQLLVFDGSSLNLIATLRTATSPTMMAMTSDQKLLLVGHDDSGFINVYDLDTLQPLSPVLMPGGHFARSIAVSNSAILAMVRNEGTELGTIDIVDLNAGKGAALPALGVFMNQTSPTSVLAASPSGGNILLASADGAVALYSAAAGTFVLSRKDFSVLFGAFAASDYGSYIIGNTVFDASLVPLGTVSPSAASTSGFAFADQGGYLASASSLSAGGSLLQIPSLQQNAWSPMLLAEAPLLPIAAAGTGSPGTGTTTPGSTIYGTYGSGGLNLHASTSFTRTVAPMPSGSIVLLTTSGLTLVKPVSLRGSPPPVITGLTNAADSSKAVAPGGLISIYGENLSAVQMAATTPVGTQLGDACLGVNGLPIPLLYVSPGQINAQLPFGISGNATLTIHAQGGTSNNYQFSVQPTAPSVFLNGSAGPQTGLAAVVRDSNGQLVTPTNPVHPKDVLTIYLTGMGQTSPAVGTGQPAPANPLALAAVQPVVTLGGAALTVGYAGMTPGEIGVYQIVATVPWTGVSTGLAVPLTIAQGGASTTVNLRVVE